MFAVALLWGLVVVWFVLLVVLWLAGNDWDKSN
jgi:hypothetical protein